MLTSAWIPQYDDEHVAWSRFLQKAARGSCKAFDILLQADLAYMAQLVGDPRAPETIHLPDYQKIFCAHFPAVPPVKTIDSMIELACQQKWIPHRSSGATHPHNSPHVYQSLWKRATKVDPMVLLHDSMVECLERWSPQHCLACIDDCSLDYDSRNVVTGLLYLALTW